MTVNLFILQDHIQNMIQSSRRNAKRIVEPSQTQSDVSQSQPQPLSHSQIIPYVGPQSQSQSQRHSLSQSPVPSLVNELQHIDSHDLRSQNQTTSQYTQSTAAPSQNNISHLSDPEKIAHILEMQHQQMRLILNMNASISDIKAKLEKSLHSNHHHASGLSAEEIMGVIRSTAMTCASCSQQTMVDSSRSANRSSNENFMFSQTNTPTDIIENSHSDNVSNTEFDFTSVPGIITEPQPASVHATVTDLSKYSSISNAAFVSASVSTSDSAPIYVSACSSTSNNAHVADLTQAAVSISAPAAASAPASTPSSVSAPTYSSASMDASASSSASTYDSTAVPVSASAFAGTSILRLTWAIFSQYSFKFQN